jgi:hypothetical protein
MTTISVRGIGVTITRQGSGAWIVRRNGDVLGEAVKDLRGFWRASSRWTADGVEAVDGVPVSSIGHASRGLAIVAIVERAQSVGRAPGPPAGWQP